ncbi:MAG TPA: glutamate 5-kinase [Armatimonadetes bacterium]|nr:glutamate 5-kinase [Armatimonadota bacterium]
MPDSPVMVVKVGTSTLTTATGDLDLNFLRALSDQLCELTRAGQPVVLVSSGAIRAGMYQLGLRECRDLPSSQAAAAVGQIRLMQHYASFCRDAGVHVAQVLLSRGDVANRERYLNARNTLRALLARGVLPIINENDTVTTEEIQFGDNDQLSSQVCQLVLADVLLFLTDIEGFMMPDSHGEMQLVAEVPEINRAVIAAAGGSSSGFGRGGMASKINAARIATRLGARVVIARGKPDNGVPPVRAVAAGERVGTTFSPAEHALRGRKRWLATSAEVAGELTIDDGAARALLAGGHSLLAVGVREVRGDFGAGSLLLVRNLAGTEVARGLSNFSASDLRRIAGLRGDALAAKLGQAAGPEVIHLDNMALVDDVDLVPTAGETP